MKEATELLDRLGINYRVLNHDKQLNIQAADGYWHSFYPSSGTMVFNKPGDWTKKRVLRNVNLSADFINKYFMNPDEIQKII